MKTLLFKPLEKFSDSVLWFLGVAFTLIGSLLGYWMNARFDGVLDLHFAQNVHLQTPFFDNLVNIFSLVLLLFFAAKYINKKTRVVDILVAVMIARLPLYLLSLMNINGGISRMAEQFFQIMDPGKIDVQKFDLQTIMEIAKENAFLLTISSILSILGLIWYISLLYNGYKTASHAKGTKPVVLFILALILAEVLSKILIYTLN